MSKAVDGNPQFPVSVFGLTGGGSTGGGGGGTGTVTSVGLAAPAILSVSGSPVATSGTLTLALATQAANLVFAGPTSGGAVAPTFRALVAGDIPSLSSVYQPLDADLTALAALSSTAGMLSRTGAGAFTQRTITGTANQITVANGDGAAGNPTLSLPASLSVTNITMSGTLTGYLANIILDSSTSRTLSAADQGAFIYFTSSSAVTVTGPDTLPAGFSCNILREGTGTVTTVVSGGASLHSDGDLFALANQYSQASIVVTTNSGSNAAYRMAGNLA